MVVMKITIKRMKFEILKAKNKQFYFVLKSKNGEIVATSETYKSKQACIDTIKLITWGTFFSKTIDLT